MHDNADYDKPYWTCPDCGAEITSSGTYERCGARTPEEYRTKFHNELAPATPVPESDPTRLWTDLCGYCKLYPDQRPDPKCPTAWRHPREGETVMEYIERVYPNGIHF